MPSAMETTSVDRRFRFRGESRDLDAAARAAAPGQFVALPEGRVHYEIAGPPEGQIVVLVHGFSVPYHIWDPTFVALVEAGFRVLRYDLYGRGYSDRPDVAYDADLFDRQLLGLLSALNVTRPVDLVGLSMGGAIAIVFTHRHPDRVRRLCLIDPAGLPQKQTLTARLVVLPRLGEWMMNLLGDRVLLAGLQDDFYDTGRFPDPAYVEKYRQQMPYRGFKRALLSTLRSGFLTSIQAEYEEVGRQDRPVLLIWGRQDRVLPFALSEQVRRLIPGVEFRAIERAGHVPHYERPEQVNPLLTEFLMGYTK